VVKVCDNGSTALCDEEEITVTVNEVNAAPVLDSIGDHSVAEGTLLSFTATASDDDLPANALTFSLEGAPTGAAITSGGDFTWTPTEAQGPGAYDFIVKVCDDGSPVLCDEEEITVTVGEDNDPPILDPIGDQAVDELAELAFTATASDSDSDPLTFSLEGAPTGAAITSGGSFTWTPTEAQGPGAYDFVVKVCDDDSLPLCDEEEITVTVNEVNTAPVLDSIGDKSVAAGSLLEFTATAGDVDLPANALTFSLEGAPTGAAITSGGDFTWTPTEAQGPGAYDLVVKVCDDGSPALCDEEEITVTVSEANVAPFTAADTYTTEMNTPLVVAPEEGVLANDSDADGDALTAVQVIPPAHGFLALNPDGSFIFTPETGFTGVITFTYQAYDGQAYSAETTVQITVTEVPASDEFQIFMPVMSRDA
jgi:hypothetical protein